MWNYAHGWPFSMLCEQDNIQHKTDNGEVLKYVEVEEDVERGRIVEAVPFIG